MKAERGAEVVIFNFARLMRGPPRSVQPEEVAPSADAPPERFTEKISDEGGDVYVAPVLEALRSALAKRRAPGADASPDAPEAATRPEATGARP